VTGLVSRSLESPSVKNRWKYLLGLGLFLFSVGIGLVVFRPVDKSEQAFNRIKLGMTPKEVEEAIGENGDLRYEEHLMCLQFLTVVVREKGVAFLTPTANSRAVVKMWYVGEHWFVGVRFDESDRATGVYLLRYSNDQPTWFERLRKAVGV
jgi:hypothetical protein